MLNCSIDVPRFFFLPGPSFLFCNPFFTSSIVSSFHDDGDDGGDFDLVNVRLSTKTRVRALWGGVG